jgi:uncharacterized membrane protein YbhN (UPF0104 family)
MKKLFNKIKQIAPWVVAALIFVQLFRTYPPSRVIEALRYVNIVWFVLFAAAYFGFIYLVDSLCMKKVISDFSHPVTLSDMLIARGVTYLIMVISYPASQAAYAFYLKRKYSIPIFQAIGIFLFIVFIDLMWIITLAFVGSFFQDNIIAGVDIGHTVRIIALIAYAAAFVWITFWRRWIERAFKWNIKVGFIEKIRHRRAFFMFNTARMRDYIKVVVMRIPIHATIIMFMYVVLKTFNADIPFVKILGNIPVVFLIGTLPITPGGLGTVNAAMVELLSPYITSPSISAGLVSAKELMFACTLLWMFANYAFKVILGTVLLKKVSKNLFKSTEDESEDSSIASITNLQGHV